MIMSIAISFFTCKKETILGFVGEFGFGNA